jgi:hypothetical protein
MIPFLTYIMAGITLAGSVFNAKKMRIGFLLWSITNFFWIARNITVGEYAQAVVYIANLCISVYGFVKWATPYRSLDKFYVRENQGLVTWVYYNPDAGAGGQYIFNEFDFSLVLAAESNAFGPEEFFEYLDMYSKHNSTDKGTVDFRLAERAHKRSKTALTNCTADTMFGLIELARKYGSFGKESGCIGFKPEKNNQYPLCDRPNCSKASNCIKSAHMSEEPFYKG